MGEIITNEQLLFSVCAVYGGVIKHCNIISASDIYTLQLKVRDVEQAVSRWFLTSDARFEARQSMWNL